MARQTKTIVSTLLKREGIDPFLEMATLARDRDAPYGVRARLWIELGRYCAPQLRRIEVIETGKRLPTAEAIRLAKQEVFGFGADE